MRRGVLWATVVAMATLLVGFGGTASMASPVTAPARTLSVATTSLPDGYVGSSYSSRLHAAGGVSPYTWRIVAGGLPDGLTMDRSGLISGDPTRTGKWSVTPAVTDADGASVSRALTLRIASPIDTTPAMKCPGAVFDTTTTCTLSVTNASTGPAPTGTVQYSDGRSFTDSCELAPMSTTAVSSCTVSITWPAPGRYSVDVMYFGDAAHPESDGSATFTVAPQTGGLDTIGVIRCPGATDFTSARCTIFVTNRPASAVAAPTGAVDFSYLNDEGEVAGQGCTLVMHGSTHSSHCSFSYDFDEVPSTVAINYHGDCRHHASLFSVPLRTS